MKQNIRVSVDGDLMKKVEVIAAQNNTSVGKRLIEQLKRLVEDSKRYGTVKRSALQTLKKGYHLGDKIKCNREDLYDR